MPKEKRQVPVTKNEKVVITIDDIGTEGQGIGKVDGYTLFVDGALPGEEIEAIIVKAGKNFGFAKMTEILKPSKDRTQAKCPIADRCGGCTLQHFSYEGQLEFKRNKVEQLIHRIGKIEEVEVLPTIGMDEPWHYRNKVQYPVRTGGTSSAIRNGRGKKSKKKAPMKAAQISDGTISIGYYAKRSHRVVETEVCYIQDRRNEEIRTIVLDWMKGNSIMAYNEEYHKGLIRHIVTRHAQSTGLMHVTIVINGRRAKYADSLVERLSECGYVSGVALSINREETNVIMGNDLIHLAGTPYVEDTIGDVKFHISPLSFFQVNPVQTEKLYSKVLEFAELTGQETVLDLYCGIGSISLFLAKKAKKVIGVEVVEAAIDDALHNAEINGIENAMFYCGKAEDVVPRLNKQDKIKADVVVVDPPRKGCDEKLLETIVEIAPAKIVYVSCDPATLARDLHVLGEQGYKVNKVQPVDMFPHSTHVETVCVLTK